LELRRGSYPRLSLIVNNKKGRVVIDPALNLWQSIKNTIILTTYNFIIFVYFVPKEKDIIVITIIIQNLFPQLQCTDFETNSTIL
jgi:hypothetical protein